jgi:hypothetical protein
VDTSAFSLRTKKAHARAAIEMIMKPKLESLCPSNAASCSLPSSSGISFLRVPTNRRKEKRLLPFGRCAATIKPGVSGGTRTTKGGNNLGGGILGKRFGEGHGWTITKKEMCAMQKIILALCLQCTQGNAVNQHYQMKTQTIKDLLEWQTELQLGTPDDWGYSQEEYDEELENVANELEELGA